MEARGRESPGGPDDGATIAAAVAGSPATWQHDSISGQVRWSEELRALLGVRSDEPGSMSALLARVPRSERDAVRDAIFGEVAGTRTFGHHVTRPDGVVRAVEHQVSFDPAARRFLATVRDVTAQAEIGAAMAFLAEMTFASEAETFFRACVAHIAKIYGVRFAFIALVDASGTTATTVAVWDGHGHAENFTYELRGSPCQDVMSLDETMIASGVSRLYADDRLLVDMGVESYFGAPLFDAAGQVFGIVSVMDTVPMTVSEWAAPALGVFATRVAVEVLRAREERSGGETAARLSEELELARRFEALGRLARGVAHDFNNLLTVILANAELLSLDPGRDKARRLLEDLIGAGMQARSITKGLLSLSQRELTRPEPVAIDAAVSAQRSALERTLGPGVELEVEIRDEGLECLLDAGQAEQILLNLVVNARDAMPRGGRVRVTARRHPDGERVEIVVRDEGAGMAPHIVSRVFEPFFATEPKSGSTGLGLATVYGIVSAAGGTIEVQSAVGAGTSFRVLLPLSSATSGR